MGTPAAPATDAAAAAVANVPLKPGWKTTELALTVVLLGGLGTVIEQLVQMLPTLAGTPGMPPWAAPLMAFAPVLLGLIAKQVATHYVTARNELKLAQNATPATDASAADALNKAVKAVLLVIALALALVPSISFAQAVDCDPDAGNPEPAVKMTKGSLLPEDSWVVSPAWMCAAGKSQNICTAEDASPPYTTIVLSATGGGVVVAAVVLGVLAATGHLKK